MTAVEVEKQITNASLDEAIDRVIASSRLALVICFSLCRAVSSAASLSTLARSAPVKPGVRRATLSRSIPSAIGLPREWTLRIW